MPHQKAIRRLAIGVICSGILVTVVACSQRFGNSAGSPDAPIEPARAPIEAVSLHRPFRSFFLSAEHFDGEEEALGDALGVDCLVQQVGGDGIIRAFRGDGTRNEDWFGWNAEVLAPVDGVIEAVHINPKTNLPGTFGDPPASSIRFRRADGLRVLVAHVQDIRVAQGDVVGAGQVIARVGNNGRSTCPHIHVGAWKDGTPYQIRWDLRSGRSRIREG